MFPLPTHLVPLSLNIPPHVVSFPPPIFPPFIPPPPPPPCFSSPHPYSSSSPCSSPPLPYSPSSCSPTIPMFPMFFSLILVFFSCTPIFPSPCPPHQSPYSPPPCSPFPCLSPYFPPHVPLPHPHIVTPRLALSCDVRSSLSS